MTTDNRQHAAVPVQTLPDHKLGMIQVWDADGRFVLLTVIQVGISIVTRVRTEGIDEYSTVQLGFDEIPAHRVTKSTAGHSARAGAKPRRHLVEVRTSTADNYELGQELRTTVFEASQVVDVSDNTKGRGFAGVIGRHGFTDVPASHGTYRNHRKPGSIGACATSGRIFEGLYMASRVGNVRRTVQNLKIQAVDAERGLLLIGGAVPGPKSGMVLVHSSVKGTWDV